MGQEARPMTHRALITVSDRLGGRYRTSEGELLVIQRNPRWIR
jgi:hypothetical protein